MPNEEYSQAKDLKDKIKTWANRAEMARKQGNDELLKQALDRKRDYQNALAKLQEFEVDT
jgi:phage shock protein A